MNLQRRRAQTRKKVGSDSEPVRGRLQPSRRKGAGLFSERSRDGMSEAPVKELYRGRADGVRGDEGSGGFIRTAAGYRRKPAAPAVARISLCA